MTSRVPAKTLARIAFVLSLALALAPLWRLAVVDFQPSLDQLLQLGCFGNRDRSYVASDRTE